MWGIPFFFKSKPKLMFGIDVSHHQESVNWSKVASNNPLIDFAYIKVSTGVGSTDPKALYNATQAKKNGIKIGYYHYASLNDKDEMQDARSEAEWFLKVMRSLPYPDMPLVLDIEDNNPTVHLDKGEVLSFINTFFSVLKANGISDYILYSYTPFLDEHLPTDHKLGNVKLWIAAYTNTTTPKLPKGWDKYYLWQYTAKGSVSGISTPVDLNKQ